MNFLPIGSTASANVADVWLAQAINLWSITPFVLTLVFLQRFCYLNLSKYNLYDIRTKWGKMRKSHIANFFWEFTNLAQSEDRTKWNRTKWGLPVYLFHCLNKRFMWLLCLIHCSWILICDLTSCLTPRQLHSYY